MLKKALAVAAIAGFSFAAVPAQAEPSVCAHVSVRVNEHSAVQDICAP